MSAAWQLSDLRDDLRPQSRRTLVRAVPADSYTISSNGTSPENGKTLSGRFAVFDTWAEVNSLTEGHFVEKIQRGAFAKTIRERGTRIPIMFSHGKDPVVGLQVLGQVRDLHEDAQGVAYESSSSTACLRCYSRG